MKPSPFQSRHLYPVSRPTGPSAVTALTIIVLFLAVLQLLPFAFEARAGASGVLQVSAVR